MADTESVDAVVEQAKGVIMLRYGVGSYESLATMVRWSREAHVKLEALAHALVKGVCQGRVTQDTECLVRWLEQRLRADIGETPPAPREVVLRRRDVGAHAPVPAPRAPAPDAPAARKWRHASAVHAARALTSPWPVGPATTALRP